MQISGMLSPLDRERLTVRGGVPWRQICPAGGGLGAADYLCAEKRWRFR